MNADARSDLQHLPTLTEVVEALQSSAPAPVPVSIPTVLPVPVLDEVVLPSSVTPLVALPSALPMALGTPASPPQPAAMVAAPTVVPSDPVAPTPMDEDRIVSRVVGDLQRRADQMLEYRLREALTPILERVAADLVAEARGELARTLRDVVARAVSQELAKHRRQP